MIYYCLFFILLKCQKEKKITIKTKEELKEYKKKWYENNKERLKKYNQQPKIRKKILKQKKEYRNSEKGKKVTKEYNEKNKEIIKLRRKEQRQKPEAKEKAKEYKKEYMKKPKNKERKNELQNKLRQTPKVKKRMKKYQQSEKGKAKDKRYHKTLVAKENKRRKKLNLPIVGENYVSEMELLIYLESLFGEKEINKHDREPLKNWKPVGLELDFYIPKFKLAFEYNGKQHYEWIKYFHPTKEEFEYQQYKDRCKKKLCKQKGITLIRIKYNETLSEQLILSKIKHLNIIISQEVLD